MADRRIRQEYKRGTEGQEKGKKGEMGSPNQKHFSAPKEAETQRREQHCEITVMTERNSEDKTFDYVFPKG
jgi:hypothetical protein